MIQAAIQDWWRDVVEYEYSLYIGIALGIAVAFFGGREGYRMYIDSRESAAQVVMAEAFEEYDKALYNLLQGKDSQELADQQFDDVKIAFDTVLQNHASSSLVPYALAFLSDVAVHKGDKQKAITLLGESLSKMSSTTPGYYILKTKLALIQLDAGSVDSALKDLHGLAFDQDNLSADMAAFFLGSYYWSIHDKVKAREAWGQLEASDKDSASATSPWLSIVQGKLQQIS